jgi:ribosomal protein S18 acetylase RimI-like enzyme
MEVDMIRAFCISDYEEVYQLWKRTPGVGLRSIDDSKEGIEQLLKRNPECSFVAEQDGAVVGVILSGHDGRRGYIYHACVDEAYRRRGLAQQLMEQVIKAMKRENITKLCLVCYKQNKTGNGFWKALRWEIREDLNYYTISINENNL